MPRKRRRTPQEKKRLSYARDRRNDYGQHDKGARNAIPKRKRLASRQARRVAAKELIEDPETAEAKLRGKLKRRWRKWPDAVLGDWVASRLKRRAASVGAKARRNAAAAAFRRRMGWTDGT